MGKVRGEVEQRELKLKEERESLGIICGKVRSNLLRSDENDLRAAIVAATKVGVNGDEGR